MIAAIVGVAALACWAACAVCILLRTQEDALDVIRMLRADVADLDIQARATRRRLAALEDAARPPEHAPGHCLHHYGPTGLACTLCGEPRPGTRTSTSETP